MTYLPKTLPHADELFVAYMFQAGVVCIGKLMWNLPVVSIAVPSWWRGGCTGLAWTQWLVLEDHSCFPVQTSTTKRRGGLPGYAQKNW